MEFPLDEFVNAGDPAAMHREVSTAKTGATT